MNAISENRPALLLALPGLFALITSVRMAQSERPDKASQTQITPSRIAATDNGCYGNPVVRTPHID